MEALDKKLQTKDSTVSALIISKLIQYIRDETKNGKKDILELSFLKLKCVSPESNINEIAAVGLLKLLEEGIISSSKLLEEFITLIPSNRISPGIVKVISGILYHQCLREKDVAKFNMFLPQHPFITLLGSDIECLPYIYNEMRFGCMTHNIPNWNALNYPLYQFCLCNPTNKKPNYYKMKLWINLIQTNVDTKMITKLISWMIFDTSNSTLITAELMNEFSFFCWRNPDKANCQIILPLQFSVLYHLVSIGHDPRNTLENIELLMGKLQIIDFANPILLILAKTIVRSSSLHVLEILQICELVIRQPNVNHFILESIRVSLLNWMGNPSEMSTDIVAKAAEIYTFIKNYVRNESVPDNFRVYYETYEDFIISNSELYVACKLTLLCESWKNKDFLLQSIKQIRNQNEHFVKNIIHLIFGLFVCDLNEDITSSVFEIICFYGEKFNQFNHLVLTLLLYKLSNSSNTKIHFNMLNYLPKLAATKENYLKIVTTIKVLFSASDEALKTLAMRLMSELWCINNKSYVFLEDMLTSKTEDNLGWEFNINKAHIIKQFCERKPELYGKEMVAHLSRILTNCSNDEGDIASSIALDAIAILCEAGIIEVGTTWLTLAPKFVSDKRTRTLVSLCKLASVIPELVQPEESPDLFKEVIGVLWNYVLENQENDVKEAALNALADFGFENISPYFPDEYCEKSDGSATKPLLVPGGYWINFLKNQSSLNLAGNFLIKLMSNEIDQFLKSVYFVSSSREPINYSYLPSHSIVRGIAEYCRVQTRKWNGLHKQVYIECIRVLSQSFSKPLPPYNWTFLQDLIDEPELRSFIVDLASHQVMISGTARRLMENFIDKFTNKYQDSDAVLLVYKNLKFLANSIQPVILEPFFKNTMNHAKDLYQNDDKKEFFVQIVDYLKNILSDLSIQETNKKGIITIIEDMIKSTDISEEIFNVLSNCALDFPDKLLENTTKLNAKNSRKDFDKATKFRYFLATKHSDKLKWLNDLIDLWMEEGFEFPLNELVAVFQQQENTNQCSQFTFELLGRIEACLADRCEKSAIVLLLNILIVAIVTFSGFHIFAKKNFKLNEYMILFPQSTALLLNSRDWFSHSGQIMECFFHLNMNSKKISALYRNIFGQTMQALRHHSEFKRNNNWMKYLNCSVDFKSCL